MLANFFKKTNLLNQSLLWILAMGLFAAAQISAWQQGLIGWDVALLGRLGLWTMLLILTPFIALKNNLTRANGYALLWYLSFVALFPQLLTDNRALVVQSLVVLAYRRLISMQSLKAVRSKIFDATLLLGIAILMYPALIWLLVLLYGCIALDASRDYRNWLLPIFGSIAVVFGLLLLKNFWTIHCDLPWNWHEPLRWHGEYLYVSGQHWNLAVFWGMAIMLTTNMALHLGVRPTALQGGFKKCLLAILLGLIAFMVHGEADAALLGVTFMPLAVLGASKIEFAKQLYYQEGLLWVWVITAAAAAIFHL